MVMCSARSVSCVGAIRGPGGSQLNGGDTPAGPKSGGGGLRSSLTAG
jgi:hypothetical protein